MNTRGWLILLAIVFGCAEAALPNVHPAAEPLAWSYSAGEAPTDRAIARKIAELRRAPAASRHLDLAVLFIQRRRETSTPFLLLYARDAIESALKLEPRSERGRLLKGLVLHDDHRFREAKDLAQSILKDDPDHAGAHLLAGDTHLELGDYEAAVDAYQSALDLKPDLRTYNRAAHVAWLSGDAATAEKLLALAIDAGGWRTPEGRAWCLVDLGDIARHRGDGKRALALAEDALRRVPNYVPALILKARSLALNGNDRAAASTYAAAHRRLPTVETLLEEAELLLRLNDESASSRRFDQAAALSTDDPRPLAHYLARHNREPARAVRLAHRELEARRNWRAWDTLALALMRNGRLKEAREALSHAERWAEPPLADRRLHRALLDALSGNVRAARAQMKAATRLHPNVDPVLRSDVEVLTNPAAHRTNRVFGGRPVRQSSERVRLIETEAS